MTGPRRVCWNLAPRSECVGEARDLTRKTLADWGLEPIAENAVIIVSELVTNAVVHARTSIAFGLRSDGRTLRGEVTDRSPAQVEVGAADEEEEGGRGLTIVGVLADRWGVVSSPDRAGKTVWFELIGE